MYSIGDMQTTSSHNSITTSSFYLELIARKELSIERFNVSTGCNFSFDKSTFIPTSTYVHQLSGFSSMQNQSILINNFSMEFNTLSIPINLSFKITEGWYDFYPFIWIPAISVHTGVNANYRVGTKNIQTSLYPENNTSFIPNFLPQAVSNYYQQEFSPFSLLGKVGMDFYRSRELFDIGYSLNVNQYIFSPYRTELNLQRGWGLDLRFFYIYKIQ
jgi:hypothetical protein